ncbi:MAG: hypothetical protein E6611_07365 [Intestinibacter bartlettii]|uniref:hypothetical protein n=1 Tax=Intestinibacter bartlettii TaxID=261299 RepID=UPI002907B069|nr:hypothetical protein [Intestinibacter bartlettii]MDU6198536.1 hypothetical protein [Intestinibacter bartlettii]
MKYNLQGFSQEVASELNIDGIDLYLLRWFVDFKDTNQMDTKIVDGEVYYWIYHKKVSEDMPILHLQKTAIYRRLKKLCKAQIFKKTVVRERGTFTYYAIGPNYIRLISNTPNSSIANVSAIKLPPVSPAFDDDNFGCENCRCSKCCGNFSGCDNDLGYGGNGGGDYYLNASCESYDSRNCVSYDDRDCEELATSFNLPTEGFDSLSDKLLPIEDESNFVFNANSVDMKSDELMAQEDANESAPVYEKSYEGSYQSQPGDIKSSQGYEKSYAGDLEVIKVPFESTVGVSESDRGAFESDQKINNTLSNTCIDKEKENTLTELLWSFIKKANPTFTLPDFKLWIHTFKNILYLDKRDCDEISNMIEWIFTCKDTFWSGQITDPKKLRRNYQSILAQFNAAKRAINNKTSKSNTYYSTDDFIEI